MIDVEKLRELFRDDQTLNYEQSSALYTEMASALMDAGLDAEDACNALTRLYNTGWDRGWDAAAN